MLDYVTCRLCGSSRWIEYHHIFGGAYRKKSTKHGYVVPLCHKCHNEPGGVHYNSNKSKILKREAQKHFEVSHSRQDFIDTFGRNYLTEDGA